MKEIKFIDVVDAEQIRDINDTVLGYNCSINTTKNQIKKLIKDSKYFILGYYSIESKKLLGYIHAEVYESLFSEEAFNILALAVDKNYQGIGIGKKLLQKLEEEASKREYSFIRLNSGLERKDAHEFYKSCGYDDNKLQKRFIKKIKY